MWTILDLIERVIIDFNGAFALLDSSSAARLTILEENFLLLVNKFIGIANDKAINLTNESHDSIARMSHLRKRKKEKT